MGRSVLVPDTGIDLVERSDFEVDEDASSETVSVPFTEIVSEMLMDSEWVK